METASISRAPQPAKAADEVLSTAERLNNRLSAALAGLAQLRDRVAGSRPDGGDGVDRAASQFTIGGFVGGVGQSLENSHRITTDIEDVLTQIAGVI